MASDDLARVIAAADRIDLPDGSWLRGLLDAAAPLFDHNSGTASGSASGTASGTASGSAPRHPGPLIVGPAAA